MPMQAASELQVLSQDVELVENAQVAPFEPIAYDVVCDRLGLISMIDALVAAIRDEVDADHWRS